VTEFQARHVKTGVISWVKKFNIASSDSFFRQELGVIGMSLPMEADSGMIITEYMPHESLDSLVADTKR
jgi:hypothetical protein